MRSTLDQGEGGRRDMATGIVRSQSFMAVQLGSALVPRIEAPLGVGSTTVISGQQRSSNVQYAR